MKGNQKNLDLRDDPIKGVKIAGVRKISVSESEAVMNLLY